MTVKLSKEKNYIRQIIKNETTLKGLYKDEAELFEDIEKNIKEKKEKNGQKHTNIYHLNLFSTEMPIVTEQAAKYAAQTLTSETHKTEFYYNKEKNIALKITFKKSTQVCASIIADANVDVRKTIIFCRELEKYFIPNDKGEFTIGNFDNFHLHEFNFDFLFPAEEIVIMKFGEDYIPSAAFKKAEADDLLINENFITLKMKSEFNVNAVVFKSGSHMDFAKTENNSILIPRIFLAANMKVYIY
jgi:hypothetical protein